LAWPCWAPPEPERADERRLLEPALRLELRLAPPLDLVRPEALDAEVLDPPDRLDPPDDDFDAGMVWLLLAKFEIERTQTGCGRLHIYPFVTNSRSAFWA
jgi:hypothetical protein